MKRLDSFCCCCCCQFPEGVFQYSLDTKCFAWDSFSGRQPRLKLVCDLFCCQLYGEFWGVFQYIRGKKMALM